MNNDDMFIRVQPAASSLMSPQSSMPSQTWTESKCYQNVNQIIFDITLIMWKMRNVCLIQYWQVIIISWT